MNVPPLISRRIVTVGPRRVHLRQAGSGPRLLLVHGSPASSTYFLPLMEELAADYCCVSPDTPGFGESEALPPGRAGIGEAAAATAALIEELECAPCLVLGSHTGAGIALELGLQRPDLVAGLLLDGVALFNEEERADLFHGYFEPLTVDERGGHFARTWTRIRDMFIWFPWTSHDPARLNGTDLPPPASVHRWVSMFYEAAPHYAETYLAAIRYGERARVAAAMQTRPAVYLAHERDMLAPHLDRLPPLKPVDRIERTSAAPGEWLAGIRRGLARLADASSVSSGVLSFRARGSDEFMDLPHGQTRVRRYGDAAGSAVLLLHDAPATGLALQSLARSLAAAGASVLVPDLPGYGASAPLTTSATGLAEFADAILPLVTGHGGAPLTLYGRGCGAALALVVAVRIPGAIGRLVLDELPLLADGAEPLDLRICPTIDIEADGSHWYRTWQMLRDSQTFWPWYATAAGNLLRLPGNYSAQFLHEWTTEVLRQPRTAHCLPHAMLDLDARGCLGRLTMPTTLMVRSGHPLAASLAHAATWLPEGDVVAVTDAARAETLRRLIGAAVARQ